MNVLFLCRYFVLNEQSIIIVFINDDFREDFENFEHTRPVQSFLNDKLKLIKLIVKEKYKIENTTWDKFKSYISKDSEYILFEKLVKSRKPIYNHCFNLNVLLLNNSRKEISDNFLLTKNNISFCFKNKFENKNFVTIGVR